MIEEEAGGTPVCLAHQLVDGRPIDPETARDVARFRRAERVRLMEERGRTSSADRATMTAALAQILAELVTPCPGLVIAGY